MKKDFIKRVIEKIDYFPEPVISSNIEGNPKITSKTGAFFSIILIAILVSYAGVRFQTMI